MNAQTKTQYFQIESRRIEVLVDQATSPKGLALIAHPHPLFGGTNQNKVVQTLARAFLEQGYDTWRPNFRGVGASEGVYDEGRGETEDFLALLQAAKTVYPNLGTEARCLALAGFSFGSFVASMAFENSARWPCALKTRAYWTGGFAISDARSPRAQHRDPR